MSRMPYFPFFEQDFMSSVRAAGMSLEEIGAFTMFLCWQWGHQGPVPNDAAKFAAYTGRGIRVARRNLAALLKHGKIVATDAGLESPRMTREIEKFAARSRAASEREARKTTRLSGEICRTSGESSGEVRQKFQRSFEDLSEKGNENNGGTSTEAALHNQNQNQKKDSLPIVEQDAAREGDRQAASSGLKASFNGSTEAMIADVLQFMGPLAKRVHAENWLNGTVAACGAQRTAEAWSILTTKLARGELVPSPLALWAKTARGLKPPPAAAPKKPAKFYRYGAPQ